MDAKRARGMASGRNTTRSSGDCVVFHSAAKPRKSILLPPLHSMAYNNLGVSGYEARAARDTGTAVEKGR